MSTQPQEHTRGVCHIKVPQGEAERHPLIFLQCVNVVLPTCMQPPR